MSVYFNVSASLQIQAITLTWTIQWEVLGSAQFAPFVSEKRDFFWARDLSFSIWTWGFKLSRNRVKILNFKAISRRKSTQHDVTVWEKLKTLLVKFVTTTVGRGFWDSAQIHEFCGVFFRVWEHVFPQEKTNFEKKRPRGFQQRKETKDWGLNVWELRVWAPRDRIQSLERKRRFGPCYPRIIPEQTGPIHTLKVKTHQAEFPEAFPEFYVSIIDGLSTKRKLKLKRWSSVNPYLTFERLTCVALKR